MIFTFSFFFLYCIQLPVSYESYEALFTEILFLTQIILQTDRQEQVCNSLPLPFSVYRSIPFERGRSGASSSGASSISALSFWSMFSRIFNSFNRAVFSASSTSLAKGCSQLSAGYLILCKSQKRIGKWFPESPETCTTDMTSFSRTVIPAIAGRKRMSGHVSLNTVTKKAIDSSFFITKCVLHKTCNVLHKTAFPVLVTC